MPTALQTFVIFLWRDVLRVLPACLAARFVSGLPAQSGFHLRSASQLPSSVQHCTLNPHEQEHKGQDPPQSQGGGGGGVLVCDHLNPCQSLSHEAGGWGLF